ncbi:zf-CSL-domain-containing protein [Pyrenochaeta sp. DS3sAY3a]|nr:zf-CSL-domain-containing protein [Pyrenochaeta sp. DS3sAY3a]
MADEEVNLYDEIEIEDCFYDETLQIYHHPCPCGDRFEISIFDMREGEDIARCPSCSLMVRIIFDASDLPADDTADDAPQTAAIAA